MALSQARLGQTLSAAPRLARSCLAPYRVPSPLPPVVWLQCTALRYFALDGTDHTSHQEQASMIRRYIIWRNNHAYDERLRRIVDRANVA